MKRLNVDRFRIRPQSRLRLADLDTADTAPFTSAKGAKKLLAKLSIHPHPTLSETVMESAEVFFGQATHVYRPRKKQA